MNGKRVCVEDRRPFFHFKDKKHELIHRLWASLVVQMVKNLPAMQETWVRSLGWEDPLEVPMVTHSSILAWSMPMDRGAWQATVHGVTKSLTRLSE